MADRRHLPPEVHRGARTYTWRELVELTSAHRARAAVAAREVFPVLPGRFASTPHAMALHIRAHAATRAAGGVLTGAAALFAWGGLGRAPREVMVAHGRGYSLPSQPWLTSFAPTTPVTPALSRGGVPIADATTAAIHEWVRGEPARRAGRVIEALRHRAVSTEGMRAALVQRTRTRDRAGLLEVLDAFDAGAQSYLELESLTTTFASREFDRFIRQHRVVARGSAYRLDMYDAETRTCVELDGDEHHALGEDRERDLARDADLATLGIQTVRLSYRKVMDQPAWCRSTVLAVLRARSQDPPR
ncbi:endonuclease domain-containing protein [Demequina iriomotensis]|uniref:endonuclease domain-containing protein n=1 Tax=Demequina iriomotensis TaxID=1536641 RepID=UPI0007831288|nr:DUF559 domain-containing protein [Demequina iriomotensis]